MASKNTIYFSIITGIAAAYFLVIYLTGEMLEMIIGHASLMVTLPGVFVFAVVYHRLMDSAQDRVDKIFGKVKYESEIIAKKFSQHVTKIVTTGKLAEYITRAAYRTFKLKGAAAYILDDASGLYICRSATGSFKALAGHEMAKDSPVLREMAQSGKTLFSSLAKQALPAKRKASQDRLPAKDGLEFYVIVPSIMRKKTVKILGFLAIDEKISGDPLTAADLRLLETLSGQVTLGLENSRLYESKLDSLAKLVEVEKLSDLGRATSGVARQAQLTMQNIEAFARQFPSKTHDKEFLEKTAPMLYAEVEKMRLLMQGVLEYSKQTQHVLREIDAAKIAIDTIRLVSDEIAAKGVRLRLHVAQTLLVKFDKQLLKQAILNTVLNAIEATPSEGIIDVMLSHGSRGLRILVEDNGRGIPLDIIDKIFEPFFSTKEFGIGLGLTIVRNNLRLVGGSISVSLRNGGGVRVEMIVPNS